MSDIIKSNLKALLCRAGAFLLCFLACSLVGVFYIVNMPRRFTFAVTLVMIAVVFVHVAIYYLRRNKFNKNDNSVAYIISCMIVLSFVIRADYIIYTPVWVRQHDVVGFGAGFGQAAFIEYFFEKVRLIDFDPRKYWGFFQPPLHHILAGLYLRFQVFLSKIFSFSFDQACDNVQCLVLFYSMMATFYGYKILRLFKLDGIPLYIGTMLMAFHPCFILMSGSINNDMLCIYLQIISMYYFLCWEEEEHFGNLFMSAVMLGLSMMTKLSGILIAPAMAVVMLYKLCERIKNKDRIFTLIGQYLIFAFLSIPLGVWSPVRNLIRFGVPLNYTPEVGEPIDASVLRRIFDIRTNTPFTRMIVNGYDFDEFNVFLSIIKTSVVGEYDFSMTSPIAILVGWVLLGSCMLLSVLMVYATVAFMFDKNYSICRRCFMGVYMLTSIGFLINLSFSIPNFSSQDFRYIAHVIILEAVFEGCFMRDSGNRYVKNLIALGTVVFCMASLFMYLSVGYITWR